MRSRCAQFCKHLLWIGSCALVLGVLASEVALDSTGPEPVVEFEPNQVISQSAPINEMNPAGNEGTEKTNLPAAVVQTQEGSKQQSKTGKPSEPRKQAAAQLANQATAPAKATSLLPPVFVPPPSEDEMRHANWDDTFEKTIRKEYSGVPSLAGKPAASVAAGVMPPHPEGKQGIAGVVSPLLEEKGTAAAPAASAEASWEEIFAKLNPKESAPQPASQPAVASASQAISKVPPTPRLAQEIVIMPKISKNEIQGASQYRQQSEVIAAVPTKASTGQVEISPPIKANSKVQWDEIFDSMMAKKKAAAPLETASAKIAAAPIVQGVVMDDEEASSAPPSGFSPLPSLPQFPPIPKEMPDAQVVPAGGVPDFPAMPKGKTGPLPTLPPPQPTGGLPEFQAVPKEKTEVVPPPLVTPNRPQAIPALLKDNPSVPAAQKGATQPLKENPPTLLPKDSPAPPQWKEESGATKTAKKASAPKGGCQEIGGVCVCPQTIEPPVYVQSQKKVKPAVAVLPVLPAVPGPAPLPAPAERGAFSTAQPQAPTIAPKQPETQAVTQASKQAEKQAPAQAAKQTPPPAVPPLPPLPPLVRKTPESSVFRNNLEKADNIAELRKMIAKVKTQKQIETPKLPPPPPVALAQNTQKKTETPKLLPPPVALAQHMERTIGDRPLPEPYLPPPPTETALILAKLPDPLEPASKVPPEGQGVRQAVVQSQAEAKLAAPIAQTSATGACPSCGRGGPGLPPSDFLTGGHCTSCGRGDCVPGRKPCYPCKADSVLGGFLCDLYECICCPDPCYEGKWIPQADSAFFADAPRPQSQIRLGYDTARNIIFPDRSEYFWARADGSGRGPRPVAPHLGEGKVKYDELNMYLETAVGGVFSTFVSYPYLSMDPEYAPHASGFGDISVGTKTLLFDCELLQVSFQMKTTIPAGNAFKGLGTGHLSLEPALLFAIKLTHDTYLQGQLAEWIPIGGDPDYEGSIFRSAFSLNHVLCRILPDVPLMGTLEMGTLTFQHGAYTDPVFGPFQKSSGATYVTMGPGLRLIVCNKLDFGIGSAFAVTQQHFAQTLVRMEFRYRF